MNIAQVYSEIVKHHTNRSWFSRITGSYESRMQELLKIFNTCMEGLEKHTYLNSTDLNKAELVDAFRESPLLRRNIIALKSRMKGRVVHPASFNQLAVEAIVWKRRDPLCLSYTLNAKEKTLLEKACEYPEFIDYALKNPAVLNDFFKWTLRDGIEPDVFIQYPALCKKMKMTLLSARVGRFAEHKLLKVKDTGVVTLPFEEVHGVHEINLLDEEKVVHFVGGPRTVKWTFDEFANRNSTASEVEFFGVGGVKKWNSYEWGYWDDTTNNYIRVPLTGDYWNKLPTYETLSREQVLKRYCFRSLNRSDWVFVAASTTESHEFGFMKCHGFLYVAIPDQTGSDYKILPIGKYPKHFPTSKIGQFFYVTNTLDAKVAYPDENDLYLHRQLGTVPMVLNPDQGMQLMELIKKDVEIAKEGDLVFQIGYESCAFWVESLIQRVTKATTQLFRIHVKGIKTSGLLGKAVHWLKAPSKLFNLFLYCLGSFRSIKVKDGVKSFWTSPFFKDYFVYPPAMLHERIRTGELNGKLHYANRY